MKQQPITLLLIAVLITAAACHRGTKIKRSISYSGETMRIQVYARVNGKQVHDYDKKFNVAGLDKSEREAIAKHIMDSLDLLDK